MNYDQMTKEQLVEAIEQARAENETLRNPQPKARGCSAKITEKGGLSIYGLGRFPVTLYKEQWLKLLSFAQEIQDFIAEHDKEFSTKPVTKVATKTEAKKVVAIQQLGKANVEVEGNDAA